MHNFSEKVNFIWSVADLIRDTFKRSKYQDVILPLTVLRRIDCVLQPTKEHVLEINAKLKGKLENLAPQLCKASGYAFYNTSPYDFERLLNDAPNLPANLRAYINGFSHNMREVLEKFEFNNTIAKLEEAGLLFLVMEKFKNIDLHPDKVPNLEMGYIFEELIRKFNEALNENPGEHFTPREVIRLMVNLLLAQDQDALKQNHIVRTVYDPCCGSGGMLTIAVKAVPIERQGTLIRQERPWGNWIRKLELPTEVNSASIAAHFENGVLTVRVPKAAKAKPVRIPIGAADKLIEG